MTGKLQSILGDEIVENLKAREEVNLFELLRKDQLSRSIPSSVLRCR